MRARAFIKRSGAVFEKFHRKMGEGYLARNRDCPVDIVDDHRKMKYFRPMHINRRSDEGQQHLLGGQGNDDDAVDEEQKFGKVKKYPCFRCG